MYSYKDPYTNETRGIIGDFGSARKIFANGNKKSDKRQLVVSHTIVLSSAN